MDEHSAIATGQEPLIVAIDGPSGSGKSTVARLLADRLGVPVLDTGAMYRAIGLKVLECGVDPGDREAVVAIAEAADLELRPSPDGGVAVMLDGEAVAERIRTPAVTEVTSRVAAYPEVRRRLVDLQRRCAARLGAVVEGRDIGTRVFPDTRHKFFLDARAQVRAERRYLELRAKGEEATFAEVLNDIERRDARDSERQDSPLTRDGSYLVIDSSELSPTAAVERMVAVIEASGGS